jgi:hypothetical protein
MTKLLCEVLSFTLLPGQLEELRKQFELLDPEGRGEISLGALKRALMNNAEAGSLGSLTEEEVEDIFEAMRVRKTEMRIHWHEVSDENVFLGFMERSTQYGTCMLFSSHIPFAARTYVVFVTSP